MRAIPNLPVPRDDINAAERRERREHLRDIPPPPLPVPLIPVHRDPQPIREARPLLPPQLPKLRPVNGVPVVVKRPVPRVLDPRPEFLGRLVRDPHLGQEPPADVNVGHLVVGPHVVDVAQLALVQDRVEGVRRVACEEVPPGGAAVAVEDEGLAAV